MTFSGPAMTAGTLFPQLSKETGLSLTVSPTMSREVLQIRVKNVPSKDLMDRIALVSNGTWRQEGSSFRLVRTADQSRRAEAKEVAEWTSEIKGALASVQDKLQKQGAWDAEAAAKAARTQAESMKTVKIGGGSGSGSSIAIQSVGSFDTNQMPSTRAITALLAELGPQKLAQVRDNCRAVFATQPTPMQRSLGGSSSKYIRQFVAQQRQYLDAYKRGDKSSDGNRQGVMVFTPGIPTPSSGNPDLGIGQSLLVVMRHGKNLEATLTVADINGATVASGEYNLNPMERGTTKYQASKPIVFSELSQEFAQKALPGGGSFFAGGTGSVAIVMMSVATSSSSSTEPMEFTFNSSDSDSNKSQVSDSLRRNLLAPEKSDPLNLVLGECVAQIADSREANLVADLPDFALMPLAHRVVSGKTDQNDFLSNIATASGLDVLLEDGWLVVGPHNSAKSERERINRDALGVLVRKLADKRFLQLDDLAEFTMKQTKPATQSDFDGTYLRLLNPSAANKALSYLSDPWTLRIYATLTPNERSAAEANRPVLVSELTTEQRNWLNFDIFNSYDGPRLQRPRQNRVLPQAAIPFGDSGVIAERTQMLPDGLPRDGVLTFRIRRDEAVLGISTKTGNSSVVTAPALASQMYQAERPEFNVLGQPAKFDRFRPAREATYTFSYQLQQRVTFNRSLKDSFIDLDSKPVPYEGLPSDFRSKVDRQLSAMRESIGKTKFGDGGVPPP